MKVSRTWAIATASFVLMVAMTTRASDVTLISAIRTQQNVQTNAGLPVRADTNLFSIAFAVKAPTPAFVTNASVVFSNLVAQKLNYSNAFGLFLYSKFYGTKLELDTNFPAGIYAIHVGTIHDGTHAVGLTLPTNTYPNAPHITNYAAAQAFVASNNFTLKWDAFVGGKTNDYIQLEIFDAGGRIVFRSPDFRSPGALTGTNRQFVIPANTLSSGRVYTAQLSFHRIQMVSVGIFPDAVAFSSLSSRTRFTVATIGSPVITRQPQSQTVVAGTNATFTVAVTGTPPLHFQWLFNGNAIAGATTATLRLTNVGSAEAGQYRVRITNNFGAVLSAVATLTVNCGFALTPSVVYVISGGGSAGNIFLTGSTNCDWTVVNTNDWITILPTNGTGDATIDFTVDPNAGSAPRVGIVVIAGKTLAIVQRDFAPDSIAGTSLVLTSTNGSSLFRALPDGTTYRIDDTQGTYTYNRGSADTATLILNGSVTNNLQFNSPTTGSFVQSDGTNDVSGTFVLFSTRADFNVDGFGDIVFQGSNQQLAAWFMKATNFAGVSTLASGIAPPDGWRAIDTDDFNGDNLPDILFQQTTTRELLIWYMDGIAFGTSTSLKTPGVGWYAVAAADVNHDGTADIFFQHDNGKLALWTLNGTNVTASLLRNGTPVAAGWRVAAAADLSGDGEVDLILQSTEGRIAVWNLAGGKFLNAALLKDGKPAGIGWRLVGVNEFNNDGHLDLLFQHTNGQLAVWFMNGSQFLGTALLRDGKTAGPGWLVVAPK